MQSTRTYIKEYDMKEIDAKGKICPLIKGRCVASECMAWVCYTTPDTTNIKNGHCSQFVKKNLK